MQTLQIKDIIGPIMIGPSSSHTAGALRIAAMARKLCRSTPESVRFRLYGSFAHTYRGHGTDRALVAGMLGLETDDLRIRDSFALAREAGLEVSFEPLPDEPYDHPNTVDITTVDADGTMLEIRGESIGGGAAVLRRVNGVDLCITGEHTSLVIRQHDEKGVLAHIAQSISLFGINIATTRMYRERRGDAAYTIMETDSPIPQQACAAIMTHPGIKDVRVIPADGGEGEPGRMPHPIGSDGDRERAYESFGKLDFPTGNDLLGYCEREHCSIAAAFRRREAALAASNGRADTVEEYLARVLNVMRAAATGPVHSPVDTMGGLIGGEARAVSESNAAGRGVCSGQLARATAYALGVLETNASMGRIVAAPTAGSSGVIPATLLTLQDDGAYDDTALRDALVTAAAVGNLISRNATVSGAEGGCQAEIGSAAAMAAAAAVQMAGGSPAQCLSAAANAIANMLGLVCDPIAGLVEVPCQKRNASGAACALVSAEIALAGIENLVSFDETVEAMAKVGRSLPFELRESALGGLAATPAACRWCESFRGGSL
jgi:L-serine dehydratase